MAGHSKWANIRHRKERMDSKRGKIFSRLIKEIAVAAKTGGTDPAANPRLRLAVEKAREANVPNDNLERAIKRGGGQLEGADYAEIRHEGYGPGGAAIIVDCLTDNKNRTLPEVRHVFTKHGGNLGANGSVSYLFHRCGQILCATGDNETRLMEIAIENGAEDFEPVGSDNGEVEITCAPNDFPDLLSALKNAGYAPEFAEIVMSATNEISLKGEEAKRMQKLLAALEDLDDTQQIHTSAIFEEEETS